MNKAFLKQLFIVFTGILLFQNCTWQHKSTSELLKQEGGIVITLKVESADILRSLANNPQDSVFKIALQKAIETQKESKNDLITAFADELNTLAPNAHLSTLFINQYLQQINYNSSNEEVIKVLKDERDGAIENMCNILSFRIDNFGINSANIQRLDNLGHILVELPGIKEPERVRELLTNTGNLEFWETYDNTEVFEFLKLANEKLREIKEMEPVIEEKIVIDTDKEEVLPLIKKLEKLEDTDEIVTEDEFLNLKKENPLFYILRPNTDQYNQLINNTAAVGVARIEDTSKINNYLKAEQIQRLFPRNLKLLWELNAFDQKGEYIYLIALKITNLNGLPSLDGNVITNSRAEFGSQGLPEVAIEMNQEGAAQWTRITRKNVGKQIAIVFQNQVYSFPTVNSEITGGKSSVTGNFTYEEAQDLANIINSGRLPSSLKIEKETIVEPSND